jgi:hypothetical protein
MPQIYHNQALDENYVIFCYSLLALRQKQDYIRSSIQVIGYVLTFIIMSTLMMKVAVTAASILLFASIGLLVWNLIRETHQLRQVQEQILRLCMSTEYERIVANKSD